MKSFSVPQHPSLHFRDRHDLGHRFAGFAAFEFSQPFLKLGGQTFADLLFVANDDMCSGFGKVVDMEPRAQQRKKDLEQYYEPFMEKENYPTIFFEPEELDTINQIEPELIKYVNTQRAKFIVDGVDDKAWDSYVKTVEDMGLGKLMELYQTALDRYNAAQK